MRATLPKERFACIDDIFLAFASQGVAGFSIFSNELMSGNRRSRKVRTIWST